MNDLGDQFQELAKGSAAFRRDIFARNSDGEPQRARMEEANSEAFGCYFTPVRSQEQLDLAKFRDIHDTIVRVDKCETNCKAIVGKSIRLLAALPNRTDLVVIISELGHSAISVEWVLGCKNVF